MSNVQAETDKVMQFIERNREEISARILIRVDTVPKRRA